MTQFMLCLITVRTRSPACLLIVSPSSAFGNNPSFLIAIACQCQCQCQCDECDVIVYLLMTDGAAVSGWNGPEGEPAKPMDMRDYIAAAKHTPPYPEASRALTTPPVPAPEASRAQLPSIDNAWHFKGARGQNATLGYVAADLLARWSEKLLVAAIEMTLCGFRLIERGRRGDEVGSTRAGAAIGPR
jgi:hypothetical protein